MKITILQISQTHNHHRQTHKLILPQFCIQIHIHKRYYWNWYYWNLLWIQWNNNTSENETHNMVLIISHSCTYQPEINKNMTYFCIIICNLMSVCYLPSIFMCVCMWLLHKKKMYVTNILACIICQTRFCQFWKINLFSIFPTFWRTHMKLFHTNIHFSSVNYLNSTFFSLFFFSCAIWHIFVKNKIKCRNARVIPS